MKSSSPNFDQRWPIIENKTFQSWWKERISNFQKKNRSYLHLKIKKCLLWMEKKKFTGMVQNAETKRIGGNKKNEGNSVEEVGLNCFETDHPHQSWMVNLHWKISSLAFWAGWEALFAALSPLGVILLAGFIPLPQEIEEMKGKKIVLNNGFWLIANGNSLI